jgi:hypothetical protein
MQSIEGEDSSCLNWILRAAWESNVLIFLFRLHKSDRG